MSDTHATELTLNFSTIQGTSQKTISVNRLIIAGWTGRDKEAMEKHMAELEVLGIKRPQSTPVFYRAATDRLTTLPTIQVPGNTSSGEVEFVLLNVEGKIWVGVGSDHTDREVETYNITISKHMCEKPIAATVWPYEELASHWDELQISSVISDGDNREIYQSGTVAAMLSPEDLIGAFETETGEHFTPGSVMMGGTLAAIGGVRPSRSFEMQLLDPLNQRSISHVYAIEELAIAG